jgi:hypothetical protein
LPARWLRLDWHRKILRASKVFLLPIRFIEK